MATGRCALFIGVIEPGQDKIPNLGRIRDVRGAAPPGQING